MALMKCPNCGEKVSSSATKCPHCGCALTENFVEVEATEVPSTEGSVQAVTPVKSM